MTIKEIREHFKKETSEDTHILQKEKPSTVQYNPNYVKWLESKLADFLTQ